MHKLSVIIPVYNEEKTILEVLRRVREVDLGDISKEIIVVNDSSNDNTLNLLRSAKGIKIIKHKSNMGKGAAVRTGINLVTGDIIIIQDADLEYNPRDFARIISPIINDKFEVVYGSRFLGRSFFKDGFFRKSNGGRKILSYFGVWLVTFLTNLFFGTKLTDEATCYKCFKTSIIKSFTIENDCFSWEPEITAKLAKRGIKIYEVPISYRPRSYGEGKKLKWNAGFKALWALIKYKFKK